jgi:succinate dehydrogenase/fumarate reductase flavoprotein subunit
MKKAMRWHGEVDVIVVGYGGAGAAAAIAAHDAGAKVLILEKDTKGGGSTYYSGGFFVSPRDVEGAVSYLMYCAKAGGNEYFDVDVDRLTAWAAEAVKNEPWVRSLGAEDVFVSLKGWYDVPGAASYTSCQLKPDPTGVGLWQVLSAAVTKRKIEVMYEASVVDLITKGEAPGKIDVLGVVVAKGQKSASIRAKKGVILTCGGFDYDESMKKNFLAAYPNYSVGHPGNTGDAIKLVSKTGADLWHMTGTSATMCYKFPEVPVAYPSMLQLAAAGLSVIFVSKYGERFVNEASGSYDLVAKALYNWDVVKRDFANIPCWCVFDEKARLKGPAGVPIPFGKPIYTWSADNSAEIAKGWVIKADSLEELAAKLSVDTAVLKKTIADYNQYCAGKKDPDFGRELGLIPLDAAPYYAVKGYPGLWGTAGGPKINVNAEVMDVKGQPIRRLYAAGNASGFSFPHMYPLSGTAIGDCFAMGRIAGRSAAK